MKRRRSVVEAYWKRTGSVLEVSSPQIVWQSTLPRRFGIILEKILDRHEYSRIAAQWKGGLI